MIPYGSLQKMRPIIASHKGVINKSNPAKDNGRYAKVWQYKLIPINPNIPL